MDKEINSDANMEETSSQSSPATVESQDVNATSSVAIDAKKTTSPVDIIEAIATASEEAEVPAKEAEESSTPAEDAKAEETEGESTATKVTEVEEVPFHEHPRWQEKLQIERKLREEVESLKGQVARVEHLDAYCKHHGITAEQFNEVVEIAGLLNNDPAKAWAKLQPIVTVLSQFNGEMLPQDLREEVENGVITEARAKEIAKYRAQEQVVAKRGEVMVKTQQQQVVEQIGKTINDWDQTKRSSDPTFAPKTKPDAPNGLWEITRLLFNEGLKEIKDVSPAGVAQLLESAYTEAKKTIVAFQPPAKPMRTLPSNGSTVRTKPAIKNAEDIIESFAAGRK